MSGQLAGLRSRLATPRTAVLLGVLVLVLAVLVVPLAFLAGATGDSSGGGEYLGPAFGLVGFLVAWRRPGNPLGWLLLGAVGFLTLSSDAGLYAVAAYRVHSVGRQGATCRSAGWRCCCSRAGRRPSRCSG